MGCLPSKAAGGNQGPQSYQLEPVSEQNAAASSVHRMPTTSALSDLRGIRSPSPTPNRQGGRYETLGMLNDQYEADAPHLNPKQYLNGTKRQRYVVSVGQDGKLYQQRAPMNTRQSLFVMQKNGTIYAAEPGQVQRHSGFLGREPVAAAGEMRVENGILRLIRDQSGHYEPPKEYTKQFIDELTERSADMSTANISLQGDSKNNLKVLGLERERIYPQESGNGFDVLNKRY